MINKKIAVLASGANGSVIAADLVEAGLDVTLIDMWGEHIETMRANGLKVTNRDDELTLKVNAYHLSDICTLDVKFDIVLLVSKAYDTKWLTEFIKPHLDDDGMVIGVQNAMTAEMIAEIVGVERTLGCVVELASQMFEPGVIHRSTKKEGTWFGIGAFDPSQEGRVEEIAELFRNSGRVETIEDILSAKWVKLIVNNMIMGSMAILGGSIGQVLKENGKEYEKRARKWMLKAGEEALAAGQSLNYKVVPVFGLKPEDVKNTNSLLETLLDTIIEHVGPSAINTTLQDHMKGRLGEDQMIAGLVAEERKNSGGIAPASDAILELSRQIHAGELEPGFSNLDLVEQRLAGLN